ncbi:MAG: tetratricopeptide repeat protein [Polyangiales bacterium]
MKRFALLVFVCLVAWSTRADAATGRDLATVHEAFVAVAELRLETAAELARGLSARLPDDPHVRFLLGSLEFHRGRYPEAVRSLEIATRSLRGHDLEQAGELLAIARSTAEATRGFVEARSSDGRYVVRFREGPDRILLPYAMDAMRREDEALQRILGVRVPGPIRLEIFADSRSLAQVSTLGVEAIERTGTIALCKWDKLMLTSPRALARGYPWTDTIAHELVHLVLARASRDHAPVWMQEGFAKYLETAYRGGAPTLELEPAAAALFDRRLREGNLLPFDAFHPSIALLPSQEDAALAFAEVSTLLAAFHRRFGDAGLRAVVTAVSAGTDARKAFADAVRMPFPRFEESVWAEARARPPVRRDSPARLPMRFVHGAAVDDAADVGVAEAARRLRLGDMLWSRGRPRAASVEYARASALAPRDPIVASRLGRSALEAGKADDAAAAARRILRDHPTHAPAHALLASALALAGDAPGAYRAAVEAIRQNPYDPAPHCVVAEASTSDDEREREAGACRTLGGAQSPSRGAAAR